jgi:UDP-N-acetylglucosamine transferase subunit ALG13
MKKKIFVVVGSTYPLDRLIKEVDDFDLKKFEVFAQIGESELKPKNIKFVNFLNYDKIQQKIKWADVVISHAGIGTILDCLTQNKKIILFPRLKRFGEAVDDHQIEICTTFEEKYGIKWTKNEKEIHKLLDGIRPVKISKKRRLEREIEKIIKRL